MFDTQGRVFCAGCNADTTILYIKCAECEKLELCLQCFSSGVELRRHLKTHKYVIFDNGSFSLFGSGWTAAEEQLLVDSVEQFGLGNWEEVAVNIPTKTAKEVEEHYMNVYIDGYLGRLTVPADIPNRMTDHTPPIHESSFSIQLPPVDVSKAEQLEIAFMPNRDDFEYEFDNEAESLVSNLFMNPDDNDLDKGLKLAKVDMYHTRLNQRQQRKDIAREYKLVESFFNKESKSFVSKHEREIRTRLRCCSQFMKRDQFEQLMRTLVRERQLKKKITKLKMYRKYGITKFEACNEFDAALYRREKRKAITQFPGTDQSITDPKRQPEFNLLGNGEKVLCHGMKIDPSYYLTAKVLIVKDAVLKQHGFQTKTRHSASIEKSHRRRIMNFLKENGWLS